MIMIWYHYIDIWWTDYTGWFTMIDTKKFSNNFYSKALYELERVLYFHWYPDILIHSFHKLQQVSHNFHNWVKLWCSNRENMQNALKIKDWTNTNIVLQISPQRKLGSSWNFIWWLNTIFQIFMKIYAQMRAHES